MLCNALLYPNQENRIHDVLNMYIRTSSDENNVAYYTNGCEVGYGKVMSAQSIKSINHLCGATQQVCVGKRRALPDVLEL